MRHNSESKCQFSLTARQVLALTMLLKEPDAETRRLFSEIVERMDSGSQSGSEDYIEKMLGMLAESLIIQSSKCSLSKRPQRYLLSARRCKEQDNKEAIEIHLRRSRLLMDEDKQEPEHGITQEFVKQGEAALLATSSAPVPKRNSHYALRARRKPRTRS